MIVGPEAAVIQNLVLPHYCYFVKFEIIKIFFFKNVIFAAKVKEVVVSELKVALCLNVTIKSCNVAL